MSDAKSILEALEHHKETQKTIWDKIHDWSLKASPLVDGANTAYKITSGAATVDSSSVSVTTQHGMFITGLALQVVTAIPSMIAIATSKKSFKDKAILIVPLFLLTALGVATGILGVLALYAIGGPILATAGGALGLVAAGIYVGFMGYNVLKAVVAKSAIDTEFETKVDTLGGIYEYVKALLSSGGVSKGAANEYNTNTKNEDEANLANLKIRLKEYFKDNTFNDIIKSLSVPNTDIASDEQLKKVNDFQEILDTLYKTHQKIENNTTIALDLKGMIADENLVASGVNLAISVAGILLVTIGFMAFVATISFAPLFGVTLGAIGVGLTAFGLIKLAVELKYSWSDKAVAQNKRNTKLQEFIEEAQREEVESKDSLSLAEKPKTVKMPECSINTQNDCRTTEVGFFESVHLTVSAHDLSQPQIEPSIEKYLKL